MTNMDLLEAIGLLDEEIIADAETVKAPARRGWVRRVTAIAACAVLLMGGAIAATMGGLSERSTGGVENMASSEAGMGTGNDPVFGFETGAGAPDGVATTAQPDQSAAEAATTTALFTTTAATTMATTTATTAVMTTTTAYQTTGAGGITSSLDEGTVIYREDFNHDVGSPDTAAVLSAIGWTRMTGGAGGASDVADTSFALRDGRLYFERNDGATGESHYRIDQLTDAYMQNVVSGRYTLQYDLEYTGAANGSCYAAFLTECSSDGRGCHAFRFRISGYADMACDGGFENTSLCNKLLGVDYDPDILRFAHVPVTVRLQWEEGYGHNVYIKTATMENFVQVFSSGSAGAERMGASVWFALGGGVSGYLDNVILLTGWVEP